MIEIVAETGSTNSDLLGRLRGGAVVPEGYWLVADRQTAGRGRQGRDWFDGVGNFTGSTVVHLRAGDPAAQTLALIAGLALHEAVAWHVPEASTLRLKWPNDLLAKNAKVAGILLEAQDNAVVVGIGVNLVSAPELPDRASAALSDFCTAPGRDVFAQDLARSFEAELARWREAGLAAVIRRWTALAHPLGTPLTVDAPGGESLAGAFAGLAPDGALQLRLADGTMRAIHAGDVLIDDNRGNDRDNGTVTG